MKISRQTGTVNQLLNIYAQDFNVTTGAGIANIPATTVSYTWFRNNQNGASTGTGVSTSSMGTYTSGAWTQVNSSTALGWYQFGIPNDALLSGDCSALLLRVSTGVFTMAPVAIEIELTKTNNQVFSSTNAVGGGVVGVSSITFAAATTITQGVNATTGTLSVGLVGVSTITLSAASTISQGVNATTGTLSVGLVGVSTITASAATTITQGVNSTTNSGLIGVSTITLGAASTITQGVNSTTNSGLIGVSTITLGAASTITQGVNATTGSITLGANSINFASFSTDAYPLFGVVDAGTAQTTTANTIQLRTGLQVTSTNIYNGHTIYAYGGAAGAGESRLVTSWSATTAGVDTWDEQPTTSTKYVVYATPPGSRGSPAAVNIVQIQGQNAVTTVSGILSSGLIGVSTITLSAASTITQGVNATTGTLSVGLVGVSTITLAAASTITQGVNTTSHTGLVGVSTITLGAASTITQGVNATTGTLSVGLVGVSTITLAAASTITQGVNATTGTLSVGLVGVSTITLAAASTITQGVNATTGTLSVGLVGVSTITLAAASTITQGVNATTGTLSVGLVGVSTITASAATTITQGVNATTGTLSVGLVGVSSITLGAASTITGGVNVTNMAAAAQASLAGVILTTTQAESYRTVNAPGSVIQLMYEAAAHLGDFANVGTTKTLHSVTSHTGNVATYGYDSSTSPSSITRTS